MAKALHITEAIGLGGEILMGGTLVTDADKIKAIEDQYSSQHNLFVVVNLPDAPAAAQPTIAESEEH